MAHLWAISLLYDLIRASQMEYLIHIAIMVCLYLILAQSFNVVFGLGGLLNLAHVAAYALGAYSTALMTKHLEAGFFSCLLVSALVPALLSVLVGAISLRLSGDYFAIGTLAFGAVINAILVNFKSFTGGVLGIPGIPRPELFNVNFNEIENFLYLALALCALSQIAFYLVFRGPFARALLAQSQTDYAAQSLGWDTRLLRNLAFMVSAVFAGMAGSLFAYYLNFIDPTSFALNEMVFVLTLCVVGRPGSFWGMFLSCILLVALLPEGLRQLQIEPSILGPMRQLLHAVILFAVVWWYRDRLFPAVRSV